MTVINQSNHKMGAIYLIGQIVMSMLLVSIVKVLQPEFSVFLILFFMYLSINVDVFVFGTFP